MTKKISISKTKFLEFRFWRNRVIFELGLRGIIKPYKDGNIHSYFDLHLYLFGFAFEISLQRKLLYR